MKIILIGYRCAGKTSVGREIAKRLGVPFYDTDELIQSNTGKTIREIVDTEGWDAFRREERAVIKRLPSRADAVIAAGGGAIMDTENRNALKRNGFCIWLTVDVRTIIERMTNDQASNEQRPPFSSDGLGRETVEILAVREPVYQALADCIVDTSGKEINVVTDEVCSALARRNLYCNARKSRAT
jgi:shikimate kinase